jgi:hypothetical protein
MPFRAADFRTTIAFATAFLRLWSGLCLDHMRESSHVGRARPVSTPSPWLPSPFDRLRVTLDHEAWLGVVTSFDSAQDDEDKRVRRI